LDLYKALTIKRWTPLSELNCEFSRIDKNLLNVGKNLYFFTRPHDRNFVRSDSEEAFITLLYWGASVDAIKRCVNGEVNDVSLQTIGPPKVLLQGTSGTYKEILERTDKFEIAQYNSSGQFLHKRLRIDSISYFYLGLEANDLELPYVIQVRLD